MTNVADPGAPDLAARVLDVRSETGMLFMSAIKDPEAIRFRMIDDGSAVSHNGGDPDATAGNSYQKINRAEFDQNQSRQPVTFGR
jgi:hypothetical protein